MTFQKTIDALDNPAEIVRVLWNLAMPPNRTLSLSEARRAWEVMSYTDRTATVELFSLLSHFFEHFPRSLYILP